MSLLLIIAVTFFAGMGAGLGTGFAGMSAAAVISPMLITFLGMDPYVAVGIALSSDVLASAISAYTYGKTKTLILKWYYYDGKCPYIYSRWKLCIKSRSFDNYGEFFSIYDFPSWNQIYSKTCYDNKGSYAGCIR